MSCVPHEPPTHEELDRRRRFLESERIAFEWEKLQRERTTFNADASSAFHLLELAQPRTIVPMEALSTEGKSTDENTDVGSPVPADSMIGRRVCRYWEGSKRYFPGTVVASNVATGGLAAHYVRYDDGEEKWESEVEDIDDVPICQRTSACWKRAGHVGKCIGKKCISRRKTSVAVNVNACLEEDDDASTTHGGRAVRMTRHLSQNLSWAILGGRKWHSKIK